MTRSKPAQTLTTYLAYPSTGRFSHYEQDRVITIREGLRLQSFDDRFRVLGNLAEQSNQVGNAVPPLLAAAFKNIIVEDLEKALGVPAVGAPKRPVAKISAINNRQDNAASSTAKTANADYSSIRHLARVWRKP